MLRADSARLTAKAELSVEPDWSAAERATATASPELEALTAPPAKPSALPEAGLDLATAIASSVPTVAAAPASV
jgi:hypothetical protein